MNKFMDYNHPDAFVDHVRKEPRYGMTKECPRCKGYGGWNLQLNAYPLHTYPNTPENRHRYSHYRSSCGHCNGWGFVSSEVTCDGHEWKFEKNLGRCYNRHRCTKCGQQWDVDSGD